jgi:hypothetical protein
MKATQVAPAADSDNVRSGAALTESLTPRPVWPKNHVLNPSKWHLSEDGNLIRESDIVFPLSRWMAMMPWGRGLGTAHFLTVGDATANKTRENMIQEHTQVAVVSALYATIACAAHLDHQGMDWENVESIWGPAAASNFYQVLAMTWIMSAFILTAGTLHSVWVLLVVGETNSDFEARELLKSLGRKLSAGFMFTWVAIALIAFGVVLHMFAFMRKPKEQNDASPCTLNYINLTNINTTNSQTLGIHWRDSWSAVVASASAIGFLGIWLSWIASHLLSTLYTVKHSAHTKKARVLKIEEIDNHIEDLCVWMTDQELEGRGTVIPCLTQELVVKMIEEQMVERLAENCSPKDNKSSSQLSPITLKVIGRVVEEIQTRYVEQEVRRSKALDLLKEKKIFIDQCHPGKSAGIDALQKAGIVVEGQCCALLDADLDLETLVMVAKDLPDTWGHLDSLIKEAGIGTPGERVRVINALDIWCRSTSVNLRASGTSGASGAPAAPAASAIAGWDFEKEIGQIFATESLKDTDVGDKSCAKAKGKSVQGL